MNHLELVTIIVIVANALVSIKGFNDFSFFERYKFNIGAIKRGEQVRMITSGFLHADLGHLIVNMFTLYFFASVVINYLSDTKFLIVYFVSLLAGNLLSLFIHKDEYHYSAVGASGAVTGVLYAAILLYPEMHIGFLFIPLPIPAYVFGILYLLYSIYGMKRRNDNIGHTAHFGGAIGGLLVTILFYPEVVIEHPLMVILLAIPIIILFILEKAGKL
ncbi:rhomboid family intramembrane serine protease [Zhouia sp. PK063]|uniref:rhomboid family intramembrane serine protease n=1 Tax=Zhouia sp. PK063 TaxID=3373602 RepID=UPI0037A2A878